MTSSTLKTTATALRNSSSYGADVIHYAGLKGEADSGPLYFALAYASTLADLASKISYAASKGEVVRPIVLEHWQATPEGEAMMHEYASLKSVKAKTPEQAVRQQALLDLQNQVNIQAQRNIETCAGIDRLKTIHREVNIQRIQGTNKYACYVISNEKNMDGTQVEFIHVPFTATQLRKLGQVAMPNEALAVLSTTDIRKECDSLKQGTPNNNKGGNGEAIPRGKIGDTAKALEASLSGTFKDGKLEGVSATTREAVMMLYAMVHREASEAERNAALTAYDALATDKVIAPVVEANKAKLVEAVKAKAKRDKVA